MSSVEQILHGLDGPQLEAVTSTAQPLCLLAGAGSGKTRVLTRRVAYRISEETAEASHTLILTFTRKAADELRMRLRQLQIEDTITVGTFHSVAYAELRRYRADNNKPVPTITRRPLEVLETALAKLRMDRIGNGRAVLAEISWAKAHRVGANEYAEAARRMRHRGPLSATQFVRIYEAYEAEKRKRQVWDFDDLLVEMCNLLANDRRFAAGQAWRFRHFFVDEFQDLNQAQFDLLRLWLGDRTDLFVVGDPNQAIYGWNGADATFLNRLEHWYPTLVTQKLSTNYRSTMQVLAAAHAVLPDAKSEGPQNEDADVGNAPTLRRFPDEEVEAQGIVREMRKSIGGRSWGDIAVLVRTNAQRMPIEAALTAAQIPFRSAGASSWLNRPELRPVTDYLQSQGARRLVEVLPDVEAMAAELPAAKESLDELLASGQDRLADDPGVLVKEFLSWVEVASRFDGAVKNKAAVTVTTFHRAKGLEWDVVFLAGVEEGLVPFGNGTTAQREEEQRLFYVALTRAHSQLHVSFAAVRTMKNGPENRNPSPWLTAVANARMADDQPNAELAHSVILERREALDLRDDQVDPKRSAVEKWRASRAKMTGIDPQLILSDEVIAEIIDLGPKTSKDLAGVVGFGPVKAASMGDELIALLGRDS